jgi:hypothetical protein
MGVIFIADLDSPLSLLALCVYTPISKMESIVSLDNGTVAFLPSPFCDVFS